MDDMQAVLERHSVRSYTGEALPADALKALRAEIDKGNREGGLHMQLVTDEPDAFNGRLARYGKFSNVSNYIVLVGAKSLSNLDERCGYYGQRLVLLAQRLGLNTCWVGLTYKKVPGSCMVEAGEKAVAVIGIGRGTTQGVSHKVKTREAVCPSISGAPEWFARGVDAALLAPTAMNQQKFTLQV